MSTNSLGEYFLSKGIKPTSLTGRLEYLKPLEREVLLARAQAESLRSIGKRLSLTAEGVRYLEMQAISKVSNDGSTQGLQSARDSLERQYGKPLEELIDGMTETEKELLMWHANGHSMSDISVSMKMSLADVVRLRDEILARLRGTSEWMTRTDEWDVLKATVVRVLNDTGVTYAELTDLLQISQTRLSRLMNELVSEGKADVTDDIPLRFVSMSN